MSEDGFPAHPDEAVWPVLVHRSLHTAPPQAGGGGAQVPTALEVQVLLETFPWALHILLGVGDHLVNDIGTEDSFLHVSLICLDDKFNAVDHMLDFRR